MIEFPSNGDSAHGYLTGNSGPGIIVIQEWWGLGDHIKDVADRFAAEGYIALAPDLYHGKITKEPDEALKLLMALDIDRAARDMSGSVHALREQGAQKVGSVGFCMGGNLALLLATVTPLDAAVGFYPAPRTQPQFADMTCDALIHVAEHDQTPSPEMVEQMAEQIRGSGHGAEVHIYPGTEHAFFNDSREVYDPAAAKLAWERTLAFFNARLR